jgi:hypothetical protein
METRGYSNNLRLVTFETFNSEFERQIPQHETYNSAFQAAEEVVGKHYTSYESFRVTRARQRRKGK